MIYNFGEFATHYWFVSMMQKMRTFYLTGFEIFDGFSGPFYYENYNSAFIKNRCVKGSTGGKYSCRFKVKQGNSLTN